MAKTELVWTHEIRINYRAKVGPLIVVVEPDPHSSKQHGWWVWDRTNHWKLVAKGEHQSIKAALREAEEAALRIVKAEAEAAKGAE